MTKEVVIGTLVSGAFLGGAFMSVEFGYPHLAIVLSAMGGVIARSADAVSDKRPRPQAIREGRQPDGSPPLR
jgi:hypothetical protein